MASSKLRKLVLMASALTLSGSIGAAEVSDQLREQAMNGNRAWELLESLMTEVGPRPVGSPGMDLAKEWAIRKLTALGFSNVHVESFTKENAWVRGVESGFVVAAVPRRLSLTALGNSVSTPAEGIEAEVAVFPTLWSLINAAPGSLKGKIALVNQPMVRTQNEEGYRAAVRARIEGPSLAADRGAVAYLTRSITASDAALPHTGLTRYATTSPRIPAAALAVADADFVARLASRGGLVRLRLLLQSTVIPKTLGWNIVGELKGREFPEQIVLIGGHLDSWDLSESASDDGAGVAITAAAAALIGALPHHPRRTIRVVLWGSEETERSGAAYAAAHQSEVPNVVLAAESDFGAGHAYRLSLPRVDPADPRVAELAAALAPLKILVSPDPARSGGSDVEALRIAGVPVASFNQDQTHYFDVHHSADDTLERVDRTELNQNVAAWAVLIYMVAESGIDFRAAAP